MTIEVQAIWKTRWRHTPTITTMLVRYPRFIHSEFMTHRMFSRNASSSRAIPTARLIQDVRDDIAMPVEWGKNMGGMQAKESLSSAEERLAKEMWRNAAIEACDRAENLSLQTGVHKQIVNRIIEPFSHITVLVTATEWDNFYELRRHPDAQPEIHKLADEMYDAYHTCRTDESSHHLPFIKDTERTELGTKICMLVSAARCARTSYLTHQGIDPSADKDMELATKLLGSRHMSPFEHQAVAASYPTRAYYNLRGWFSQRWRIDEEQGRNS